MMASAAPSLAGAPPPAPIRPRVLTVGTALAAAASLMFFVGLIGIYVARRADTISRGERWLAKDATLHLSQPTMMAITLGLSLVTILWAADALRKEDRQNAYIALGLTLLFGIAFFNQGTYLLVRDNVAVKTESGMMILTIQGAQLLFTVVTVAYLMLVSFRALFGQYRRIPEGVTAAAVLWYTNAFVFSILWYAIYVTK